MKLNFFFFFFFFYQRVYVEVAGPLVLQVNNFITTYGQGTHFSQSNKGYKLNIECRVTSGSVF